MANLMAAVANGGTLYRPWFVRKVETPDGKLIRKYGPEKIRSIPLRENTLYHVRRALREVVNTDKGTGKIARSALVEIAGKTGTAQVAGMGEKIVKSEELPYHLRDHAWFVAYAPAEKPEIAVVALVEHGGRGGSVAGPLAKTVIEKYFSLKGKQVALSKATRVVTQGKPHVD
jgi:penicillin-binding protein 2